MNSFPQEVEDAIAKSQDAFVWEAPSYLKFERGPSWYFIMTLSAIALMAFAVWTANFMFAFIILLMAILLLLVGNKDPEKILVQVGDNGIVWNGKLMLFKDLDRFGIVYQPPMSKVLYIESRSMVIPRMRVELEDQDPIALRNHLRQYVQENLDLQNEYFSDIVARLLRI
ncbi:MAG: hypothetical protein WCK01_02975 [Candidatus Uhrbacteria bacterium]